MDKDRPSPFLIVIIFLALISFLLLRDGTYQKIKLNNIQYVELSGIKLKVELALTEAERGQGLSGRSGLNENEGMLFIFDKPGRYSFWMKNMNFAIDMIWIGEDSKIIYIKKDAKPENYLETYGPDQDAKYVLEVVSGFSEKNNLREGDKVLFTY